MKFAIISDLHMEFQPWFHDPDPDAFYLCAGDVHPNALMRDYFFSLFKGKIFAVKGNHDYYGGSFRDAEKDFGIRWENNLKIAGATLWTYITPERWWDFREYMMDYRQIKGMNYDRYLNAHKTHHDFLFQADADIWVIHHLPSYQSVHEDYRNSNGNDFFATELSDRILLLRKPPKLIVHGHTHKEMDYMIGDTRVVCHPRGYPGENGREAYLNYAPKYVEL